VPGVIPPQGSDFAYLYEILGNLFLPPVEVPLNGNTTLRCISHSPSFVSSPSFLRVHSVLSPMLLMKMLNITGPSIDLLGTPLVSGIQEDFTLLITSL